MGTVVAGTAEAAAAVPGCLAPTHLPCRTATTMPELPGTTAATGPPCLPRPPLRRRPRPAAVNPRPWRKATNPPAPASMDQDPCHQLLATCLPSQSGRGQRLAAGPASAAGCRQTGPPRPGQPLPGGPHTRPYDLTPPPNHHLPYPASNGSLKHTPNLGATIWQPNIPLPPPRGKHQHTPCDAGREKCRKFTNFVTILSHAFWTLLTQIKEAHGL